jgi:single-stranded DNA-binding protein
LAENVAASIKKGDTVLVSGRVEVDEYTKKDGSKGKSIKVVADEVGFSMRWNSVVPDQTGKTMGAIKKAFPNSRMDFADEDSF